jgi:hypothetical protein
MAPNASEHLKPRWTSQPEVVAARERMIRSTQAWNAIAPEQGSGAALDANQELLLSEALFAQRLYQDAKASALAATA